MHAVPSAMFGANKKLKADLGLAFATFLWGSTFVVVKSSLDHASVFLFLALRFTLAGLLMAVWRAKIFRSLDREQIFAGMRLGFFMFGGYAFQTAGLQYTTASNSGFVTGSSVVLVPLLFALFWGRRLTAWVYAGAVAAGFGLYYLTVPASGVAHLNRGDVLTFVAAASYAVHIILVSEYTRQHSTSALSVLQVLSCAGLSWLMTGIAAAIRWQPARLDLSWPLILGVVVCAIFATAFAFSIQLWAQQYTTPGHAAILFTLEPVFAVLTSYIFLGERLAARAIFGAAFVLAGILIAELLGPAAAPESAEPTGDHAQSGL